MGRPEREVLTHPYDVRHVRHVRCTFGTILLLTLPSSDFSFVRPQCRGQSYKENESLLLASLIYLVSRILSDRDKF